MITFYFCPGPNPFKVALYLEECGLPYEVVHVDIRKGDQHAPDYTTINPNAKAPSIVDDGTAVFDSNAILLYLAEKTGQFLPANTPQARAEMYSWLMFIATGVGPYSGQAVHFRMVAPEPKTYALNRYDFEAWRHWQIIEDRLATRPWMLGDTYTLVDMALWGWARALPRVLAPDAWDRLPHLQRHFNAISARPAAQRADALPKQHTHKTDMDAAAHRAMFPQNARLAA